MVRLVIVYAQAKILAASCGEMTPKFDQGAKPVVGFHVRCSLEIFPAKFRALDHYDWASEGKFHLPLFEYALHCFID